MAAVFLWENVFRARMLCAAAFETLFHKNRINKNFF
jgi:hypothetical protein